jgi:simple sugar transport system permease protein
VTAALRDRGFHRPHFGGPQHIRARVRTGIVRNRKFLPLTTTIGLFLVAYALGALFFEAMREGQAFTNLFDATPFLLICAVGETLVIISGGIDLSVSGIMAFTTVCAACLLQLGWNPWLVILVMLVMGAAFGLVMGIFIAYLKVQPFIATLAGMWLARGLCYVVSDNEVRIYDPTWKILGGTHIFIPGLSDPALIPRHGVYITILVFVALTVLAVGMYLAHFTRFGRNVYAIGGGNGANEVSARLMGLPVERTKVLVYTFSGFCSALAGLTYSMYVQSGHGTHATGFELTVIAAVVIGGTSLVGGEGFLFGSLFGVLITQLIQALIQAQGKLSSWWTYIVIGGLMLAFIGVQSILAAWNAQQIRKERVGGKARAAGPPRATWYRRRRTYVYAGAAAVVVVAGSLGLAAMTGGGSKTGGCEPKPFRQEQAATLQLDGAVIVFERNGGRQCVDELYAFYPEGRIVADTNGTPVESEIDPAKVASLLEEINNLGWFTDNIYSPPVRAGCAACYTYFTTITYKGAVKTVRAVDGGTDVPSVYWLVTGKISAVLPGVSSVPSGQR